MPEIRSRRRELLAAGTATAAGLALGPSAFPQTTRPSTAGLRVGICDWALGLQDPSALEVAGRAGLNGLEISMGTQENNLWLRRPDVREQYLRAAREAGVQIPSMACIELNNVALMSEPRAAMWLLDTIEAAGEMKIPVILVPFFHQGELKRENREDMRRVTEVLVELAPRAVKAGVTLGLESYLSAEAHMEILDAVKSPAVKVYYDAYNAANAGHDPAAEIRALGVDRICQIHFKDYPRLEAGDGKVDWPKVSRALRDIGYRGWIVLETPCPTGDRVADTAANLAFVRRLFA